MGTTIKMTPPGGVQQTIKTFDTCQTKVSTTDLAGSFSLALPAFDNFLIDAFPVGSDVEITQDDCLFRGWVIKPPKSLNNKVRLLNIEGATYTARTQKIIVTESYTDMAISDIVTDLFIKYVPWVELLNVMSCPKKITIKFSDAYLWDAMEQLCQISGFDWFIDVGEG